ncbi:MAG: hypothetical protein ACE37F_21530 [Nannocystaceae bacterium]|nr:hypothetical protein [bacterium]
MYDFDISVSADGEAGLVSVERSGASRVVRLRRFDLSDARAPVRIDAVDVGESFTVSRPAIAALEVGWFVVWQRSANQLWSRTLLD